MLTTTEAFDAALVTQLLAAAGFTPADLGPALQLLVAGEGPWYQDAARTVPAVANLATVQGGTDLSGAGNHPTHAAATCQLLVPAPGHAYNGVLANGSYLQTPNFFDATWDGAFTLLYVAEAAQAPPGGSQQAVYGGNGHWNSSRYAASDVHVDTSLVSLPYGTGQTSTAFSHPYGGRVPCISSFRWDGAYVYTRCSGVERVMGATGTFAERLSASLFAAGAGFVLGPGPGYDWLAVKRWCTDAEMVNLEGFYSTHRSIPLNTKLCVCDGDSLTVSVGATAGYDYPGRLMGTLGAGWGTTNNGQTNITMTDMIARYPLTAAKSFRAGFAKKVNIGFGGINDLINGRTAGQLLTDQQTYTAAVRAAGLVPIAVTLTPDGNGAVPPGYEAARLSYNTSLRAAVPGASGDHLIDAGATGNGLGDLADTAGGNYAADHVHYSDAGNGVFIGLAAPVVLAA